MTTRLTSRRLRLFILSLSLFCSGAVTTGQSTVTPAQPLGIVIQQPLPGLPGVTIRNVKLTTLVKVSSAGSIAGAPDSNLNRLPLPTDGSAVKIERTELHVYSMDVNNHGPKAIRALVWDFIFADTTTNKEMLRRSFANVQQIDTGKHKTIKFT